MKISSVAIAVLAAAGMVGTLHAQESRPLTLQWRVGQSQSIATAASADADRAALAQPETVPGIPLLLRFQLISATSSKTVDPSIAGIDSVLKDLFRFPGYRLLSSAAVAADYAPTTTGQHAANLTRTDQLLTADGVTYNLRVVVDTASAQMVRLNVSLSRTVQTVRMNNGQAEYGPGPETLLQTTVTISYGRTVVLGSTQPATAGTPGAVPQTLILTVKPEAR